jgi:N-acetyl-anhydromuramyl-L-alanine amidase AmpD
MARKHPIPKEAPKLPYIWNPQHGLEPDEVKKIERKDDWLIPRKLGRAATTLPYTEKLDADGNWDSSRIKIDMVVLHTTVCCRDAAANRFATTNAGASAHYLVNLDGSYWHFLEEYYTAYHAGNYNVNQRSIGIEHEDCGNYNSPRPDVLYTASAKLVRDICQYYGIAINRTNIRKHTEVSQLGTACPDSLDVDRIVREAAQGSNPTPATPNYAQAAKDALPYVKAYGTQTDKARLTGIVASFKNNHVI